MTPGFRHCAIALLAAAANGCAILTPPADTITPAQVTPATRATRDLANLPEPRGRIVAAVYGFRDYTGQYKPAPDSSFSTSVTQGAAAMLVQALRTSGWYTPVERENLQNLLTERRIVRAIESPGDAPAVAAANGNGGTNAAGSAAGSAAAARPPALPQLLPATVLIEGGIIAYESNVRTGGAGARYLGIGIATQYRVDQVSVSLRSIDIRDGRVLNNVSVTKTIFSHEVRPSVFKFVNFKDLVEVEAGVSANEPAQLCVREAIEAAVIHLTVLGVRDRIWALKNPADIESPLMQAYLKENAEYTRAPLAQRAARPQESTGESIE